MVSLCIDGEARGFTLVKVKGDGACLFNALSMGMSGTELHAHAIRSDIVAHVLNRVEDYQESICLAGEASATPGRYAQFMGKPHEYGTFVEITAAAALFQRRIVVVRGGHVECHVGLVEWPMLVMEFSGDREKGHFDLLWPSGVELHRSTVPYVSPPPRPSLRQLAMEDVVVEHRAYYNAVVEAMEVTQGDGNVAESSSSSGVQCGDSGVVERGEKPQGEAEWTVVKRRGRPPSKTRLRSPPFILTPLIPLIVLAT